MKVAVVYNRESKNVINLFGTPNREIIGRKTIDRLLNGLKEGGHQAIAVEGDKDLIDKLEEFMPRVVKGERPGMVFNVSYGIQGQARYTHVPSILEMVGIPYVASGPLAHSLALDKVVTKMILRQHGLPTPDFAVLETPDAPIPTLRFPMIVKPKNEAVSFGLRVVNDEAELREGARVIFEKFRQPVLVEQYIEGREINVGLLGNNPPEAFPPVELTFGDGPRIYSYEDKTGRSGRSIGHACPAPIGDELLAHAQEIAKRAFTVLGCADCARVDMRMDAEGNLYILEINSLPSLGEHGSYLVGAQAVGLDFAGFINRLVEVASARYFGTPEPPTIEPGAADASSKVFEFLTQHRDQMEGRLHEWCRLGSHTNDPVGVREAVRRCGKMLGDLRLKPVPELTDDRAAWTWQTQRGFEGGTLFVAHLDVPVEGDQPAPVFRKEPEWLFGDGIGVSRAPLVMLEFALRSIRSLPRTLRKLPVGVLLYTDEGRDARYSAPTIQAATACAREVLVLRPGNPGEKVISQRRGQRKYRFRVEGEPIRPGADRKKTEILRWVWTRLEEFAGLTRQRERTSISAIDVRTERRPLRLPHRVTATLLMTYPEAKVADEVERELRAALGRRGPTWELELISDRPPMKERRATKRLIKTLEDFAVEWEIPLQHESSVLPSVAGLVPARTGCVCGVGPVARDLGTPHEAVRRISLVQRTLLLAEWLARQIETER